MRQQENNVQIRMTEDCVITALLFNYCAHIAWLIEYVLAKTKNKSVPTRDETKTSWNTGDDITQPHRLLNRLN